MANDIKSAEECLKAVNVLFDTRQQRPPLRPRASQAQIPLPLVLTAFVSSTAEPSRAKHQKEEV